jgi:hypothetical protein
VRERLPTVCKTDAVLSCRASSVGSVPISFAETVLSNIAYFSSSSDWRPKSET